MITISAMNRQIATLGIKGGHFNNSGMIEFRAIREGVTPPPAMPIRDLWSDGWQDHISAYEQELEA